MWPQSFFSFFIPFRKWLILGLCHFLINSAIPMRFSSLRYGNMQEFSKFIRYISVARLAKAFSVILWRNFSLVCLLSCMKSWQPCYTILQILLYIKFRIWEFNNSLSTWSPKLIPFPFSPNIHWIEINLLHMCMFMLCMTADLCSPLCLPCQGSYKVVLLDLGIKCNHFITLKIIGVCFSGNVDNWEANLLSMMKCKRDQRRKMLQLEIIGIHLKLNPYIPVYTF